MGKNPYTYASKINPRVKSQLKTLDVLTILRFGLLFTHGVAKCFLKKALGLDIRMKTTEQVQCVAKGKPGGGLLPMEGYLGNGSGLPVSVDWKAISVMWNRCLSAS